MQRHVEAERLGGLDVDRQLELDRKLDGKLARFRAIQNFIHIRRRTPKIIALVISVGQQAAEFNEETTRIDGRETVVSRSDVTSARWTFMKASGMTIRPLLGSRACAATTISSSGASRTGAAIASTAKDAAAALKWFR